MKTQAEWYALEQELASLRKQREEMWGQIKPISKRITFLEFSLKQHKTKFQNTKDWTTTFAYQMFGKRLKELTPDELRVYNKMRQRAIREEKLKCTDNTKIRGNSKNNLPRQKQCIVEQ